jgi:hypothetical protein
VIKGSASDWARVAVRRLKPQKTRLKATGEFSDKALQVAKAYL